MAFYKHRIIVFINFLLFIMVFSIDNIEAIPEFNGSNSDDSEQNRSFICYCNDCNNTYFCYTNSYCFASVITKDKNNRFGTTIIRACISPKADLTVVALFCKYNAAMDGVYTKCCRSHHSTNDICNNEMNMPLKSILTNDDLIRINIMFNQSNKFYKQKLFILPVIASITIIIALIVSILYKYKKKDKKLKKETYYKQKNVFWFIISKFEKSLKNDENHSIKNHTINDIRSKTNNTRHIYQKDLTDHNNQTYKCDNCDSLSIITTSSGAGYPILLESRISNQIKLQSLIDTGKFGRVYLGIWKNSSVVVKIVTDTDSARHEAAIYYNYHLRHENILCFITMDHFDDFGPSQYWLIFDYHPTGSVYDFLKNNGVTTLSKSDNNYIHFLKKFLLSICAGIGYLHSEIIGHRVQKPRIAHRDIKTKNILIKSDGQCCIADLGMSTIECFCYHDQNVISSTHSGKDTIKASSNSNIVGICSSNGVNNSKLNSQASTISSSQSPSNNDQHEFQLSPYILAHSNVGTRRYLAPEIISYNLMPKNILTTTQLNFSDYLKADIYSTGIVMWEILRCFTLCDNTGKFYDYEEPYLDCIQSQPTLEQVYPIVCLKNLRPKQCLEWETFQLFKELSELINSCWHQNPDIRPRIFYLIKKLELLFTNIL